MHRMKFLVVNRGIQSGVKRTRVLGPFDFGVLRQAVEVLGVPREQLSAAGLVSSERVAKVINLAALDALGGGLIKRSKRLFEVQFHQLDPAREFAEPGRDTCLR